MEAFATLTMLRLQPLPQLCDADLTWLIGLTGDCAFHL